MTPDLVSWVACLCIGSVEESSSAIDVTIHTLGEETSLSWGGIIVVATTESHDAQHLPVYSKSRADMHILISHSCCHLLTESVEYTPSLSPE